MQLVISQRPILGLANFADSARPGERYKREPGTYEIERQFHPRLLGITILVFTGTKIGMLESAMRTLSYVKIKERSP